MLYWTKIGKKVELAPETYSEEGAWELIIPLLSCQELFFPLLPKLTIHGSLYFFVF